MYNQVSLNQSNGFEKKKKRLLLHHTSYLHNGNLEKSSKMVNFLKKLHTPSLIIRNINMFIIVRPTM